MIGDGQPSSSVPRTLEEDLRHAAQRDPAKPAVVTGERTVSFGELDAAADRAAAGLRELGVQRGDRVAVLIPNGVSSAIAIYGVMRAGAAFSPLNPTIKRDKLAYVLRDSGAAALICDETTAETAQAAADQIPKLRLIDDVDALGGAGSGGAPISIDLAAVIYTSGSTGEPKGVTLTHANMTFAADSIIEYL
jgi:long-chain acyl-CoA synthetase